MECFIFRHLGPYYFGTKVASYVRAISPEVVGKQTNHEGSGVTNGGFPRAAVAARADTIRVGLYQSVGLDPLNSSSMAAHFARPLFDEDFTVPRAFAVRTEDMHHINSRVPDFEDRHFEVGDGDELRFNVVLAKPPSAVPEPATVLMLGIGLCGTIAAARRKLKN